MSNIITYNLQDQKIIHEIFGDLDRYKKRIEEQLNISLKLSSNGINISGSEEQIKKGYNLIQEIESLSASNEINEQEINYALEMIQNGSKNNLKEILDKPIIYTASGKVLKPKTIGQSEYIELIEKNDIVFGIGPAGTGKTYLAMAMAIKAFKNNQVNRIILTRPAVEAGESLGFLPGDLQEKVDPYLRRLYDALFDILGYENYQKLVERGLVEVAPLAYMRGRTLDDAFIILDEAQNTTSQQMKMFLTRIGFGSKAIITGDVTQIDLPRGKKSGLLTAQRILKEIPGIAFKQFLKQDIVGHPLVQRIIEAYEKEENESTI